MNRVVRRNLRVRLGDVVRYVQHSVIGFVYGNTIYSHLHNAYAMIVRKALF